MAREILGKMVKNKALDSIGGIIAQGKEATIYRSSGMIDGEPGKYAIKVYKKKKVEFKNREKYIIGDIRFKHDVKNENVAIKLWAEKEFRNLKRVKRCGILCPDPIMLRFGYNNYPDNRKHIVIMSYIGTDSVPSITLHHYNFSPEKLFEFYWKLVDIIRKLYHTCGLVHSDLSPYNVLVYDEDLYIIDFAQAVLIDHPYSMDFLKRDCLNISNFFYKKKLLNIMTTKELFDYITNDHIEDEQFFIQEKMKEIDERLSNSIDLHKDISLEENAWLHSHTPQCLKESTNNSLIIFSPRSLHNSTIKASQQHPLNHTYPDL